MFKKIYKEWRGFSEEKLSEVEHKLFSNLKTPYRAFDVPIEIDGEKLNVWTITLNTESKNTPLVLVHGLAAGIVFWSLNFDDLAKDRPVYAFDIIGFARSSRPKFTQNALETEKKLNESIEQWRKYLELNEFVLLGHSMGGYVVASYALTYPDPVKSLVLCDPWGFSDAIEAPSWSTKLVSFFDFVGFNPFDWLRYMGHYIGPVYLRYNRNDIFQFFKEFEEDPTILPKYVYLCNAHPKPTGESAFWSLCKGIGYAKLPMINRIICLKENIPIEIMYGSETWMDTTIGSKMKELRPNSKVNIKVFQNSEHHIYADNAKQFNEFVNEVCEKIDLNGE